MQNKIDEKETLYRAIKRSKPDWLDYYGKPTSAMYKDRGGNSVDRDDNRTLNDVIQFMNNGVFKNRLKGIVSLNAGQCMSEPYGAEVRAAASDENPYHANIFIDEENDFTGSLQALKLADISTVVYINTTMNWVYLHN